MGILIRIKNNKDGNQEGTAFKNNAFDRYGVEYTIEVDAKKEITSISQVLKTGNTLTLLSGNWVDEIAARTGSNIQFTLDNSTFITTTANLVNGADLELDNTGAWADGTYSVGFVKMTDPLEEIKLYYNLVENSIGTGINSVIDGESVRFECRLNNALIVGGGTDDFIQLGNRSGGATIDLATVERLADTVNGNSQYKITLETKNWVFISDFYNSDNAIGDYAKFIGYTTAGDPSCKVVGEYFQEGNTGFQDEQYNGYSSDFSIDTVTFTDSNSNIINGIAYNDVTNFSIVVRGDIQNSNLYNLKLFHLPEDEEEYQNKFLPVDNNLMLCMDVDTRFVTVNSSGIGLQNEFGAKFNYSITNITVTAGSNAVIEGTITPSAEVETYFDSKQPIDRRLVLWLQYEDLNTYDDSNRVNLLCYNDQAVKIETPLGEFTGFQGFNLFNHLDIDLTQLENLLIGPHLEEDLLFKVSFRINTITDKVNFYKKIGARVVAEKTTGERFVLDELYNDVSSLQVPQDEILPLSYSYDRGFLLPDSSDKKLFQIVRDESIDVGVKKGWTLYYPFIVRYEYWLEQINANSDFFGDNTKDWFIYSDRQDWSIKLEFVVEVDRGEYINSMPMVVRNYDDWGQTPGSSIEFYDLDGVTKLNKPYDNKKVIVRAIHEISQDLIIGAFGVIHVRPFENSPQWMSSSYLDYSNPNNPLTPLDGESKLKTTLSGSTATFECLFDPSKIEPNNGKLTFSSWIRGGGDNLYKNAHKLDIGLAKTPTTTESEEDRGFKSCGTPFLKLADVEDDSRYKNDVTSAWAFGETIQFALFDSNDNLTNYQPIAVDFPNQDDAKYCTIEWRDVLINDGAGCYTLKYARINNGIEEGFTTWGTYQLLPYEVDGYYHGEGTARILAEYNDVNDKEGINFTDARVLDSIRIKGKFGYEQPNTEVDNVEYTDGRMEKVKREDFFIYELKTALINKCQYYEILRAIRGENSCWVSSYNYDDFDYIKLLDLPVIVNEGFVSEWIEGSRLFKGSCKFEDKIKSSRTHFEDNRQTAEALSPPRVLQTFTDTNIKVNGATQGKVSTFEDVNVNLIDDQGATVNPTGITLTGNSLEVTLPASGTNDTIILGQFDAGVTDMPQLTITTENEGTYTSIVDDGSSGSIEISKNGLAFAPFPNPLVLVAGDTLDVRRTVSTGAGFYKITGTY